MRIKSIRNQLSRDMYGTIECEDCGAVDSKWRGYDDRYYHDEVLPKMKCKECGKSREDLGIEAERTPTRYPEGFQV